MRPLVPGDFTQATPLPALPPVDYPNRAFYTGQWGFATPESNLLANVANVSVPPSQSRSWRVTLGSMQTIVGNPMFNANFQFGTTPFLAIVRWGVDQAEQLVAEVDWSRGRSFVVHGSTVQVDALLAVDHQQAAIGLQANAPRQFRCGATIIPATDGGRDAGKPTRTVETGVIAIAGESVVRIPPYARRVRWYTVETAAIGPQAMRLTMQDAFSPGVGVRFVSPTGTITTAPPGYPAIGGAPDGGLPIEATCMWLRVANADAAQIDNLNLEFELDLG